MRFQVSLSYVQLRYSTDLPSCALNARLHHLNLSLETGGESHRPGIPKRVEAGPTGPILTVHVHCMSLQAGVSFPGVVWLVELPDHGDFDDQVSQPFEPQNTPKP